MQPDLTRPNRARASPWPFLDRIESETWYLVAIVGSGSMSGTSIRPSEWSDYSSGLRQRRLVEDQFELMTSAGVIERRQSFPRDTVSVRRNGLGAFKEYPYRTWVEDFFRDVDAGFFK